MIQQGFLVTIEVEKKTGSLEKIYMIAIWPKTFVQSKNTLFSCATTVDKTTPCSVEVHRNILSENITTQKSQIKFLCVCVFLFKVCVFFSFQPFFLVFFDLCLISIVTS